MEIASKYTKIVVNHTQVDLQMAKIWPDTFYDNKVGCVFLMVVVSMLPHARIGPNDHRENAPYFIFITNDSKKYYKKRLKEF